MGRVLVGGYFTALGGGIGTTTRHKIGRFNADGSLDTGFDPGASADGIVLALAVQADGMILVGGHFTTLGGGGTGTTTRNEIGRLNADGSLDTSFNPGADSSVQALALQVDGKFVVGGHFTLLGGGGTGTTTRNRLGRLLVDPPVAPSVTMHPSNQTVRAGRTTSFSAAASGSPSPTVQWEVSANGGSTWGDVDRRDDCDVCVRGHGG